MENGQIILRPAAAADAAYIRSLIHRVGINPMDLNWRHFTIAVTPTGEFMGCGQLKPHRDGSLELASLAVDERFRGQGAARVLIEHLIAKAPRPLYLMCRPELQSLYEKFGFKVAEPGSMPPYFQRVARLLRPMVRLTGHPGPLIMCLNKPFL
jgi:N-acetylglutamate synthase-like GNAT family acetyltransferase